MRLTRQTLTRQVFDLLVKHISDRGLTAGDAMPSTAALMEEYGVGRSVVREALSALQVCGFVDIQNGRNPAVARLDDRLISMFIARAIHAQSHPMSALMEVRLPLEIEAARLAAERADDAGIRRIEAANRQLAKAQFNTDLYPQLDANFHADIAAVTDNHILTLMIGSIRTELVAVMVAVREYRETNDLLGQEQKQHDEIAVAISNRDPGMAGEAMEKHLKASLVLVHDLEQMNPHFEDHAKSATSATAPANIHRP